MYLSMIMKIPSICSTVISSLSLLSPAPISLSSRFIVPKLQWIMYKADSHLFGCHFITAFAHINIDGFWHILVLYVIFPFVGNRIRTYTGILIIKWGRKRGENEWFTVNYYPVRVPHRFTKK